MTLKSTLSVVLLALGSASTWAQEAPAGLTQANLFGALRGRHIGTAATSGRVSDVEGVNRNPETIYVGAAGGGVWKTVDGGASFDPIFDDYTQSIGKITVDQQHPDTVWVGTGESWVRNSVSVGTGIYRSTNGGRTWEFKGLPNSERISNIVISPTDNKTIYVAVTGHLWNGNPDRGLYKTTDAGTTWEKVLYVDENTGCADVSIDQKNPNIVYATMWEYRRSPDFFNSGGKGSGVYKSTDGGKNWSKIQNGLPQGILGRMAIVVAPSNSNTVYLTVECEKSEEKGLYKSTDAGATWARINGDFNTGVRPFYFSRMVVDPTDEKRVFKCGLNLIFSKDGGVTFKTINSGVHSDIHAVWVNPKNNRNIYLGCDGGVYRSLDGGSTFEMMQNLPLSQFYHVAVDKETPYNVYGGLQDNGSWYAPSSSPGGVENSDWRMTCYGDGFWSMPSPGDNNIVYSESQGGNIVRFNKKDGTAKDIKPLETNGDPKYRFNWSTPIAVSSSLPNRVYVGCQFLFMSENRGDTWKKISPDLTTNDKNRQRQDESGGLSRDKSSAENNTTIYGIAESPKNPNIIWVGTDDGNVQVTSDLGKTWKEVGKITGVPAFTWVSQVSPSSLNANTCYVAFDGHRTGDMKPYIFKTTDLGKTWKSLVTPQIEGYVWSIKEDLVNPNLLYAGTEFGLYISLDGGTSWARFANNFPKVAVHDIAIHPRENALVCATHGRGIIIIDDITPLRAMTKELLNKDFHVFPQAPAIVRYLPGGAPFGGAGEFVGSNPNDDAKVVYYMKKRHTFGKMEIELYDTKGKLLRTFPAGKTAGLNIVNVPIYLLAPKIGPSRNLQAIGGTAQGPILPDGTYPIKIKKGKEEFTASITIQHEANSPYPLADRQAQFDLQMKVYDILEKHAYNYFILTDIQNAVDLTIKNAGDKLGEGKAKLEKYSADLKALRESVVALTGDFYIDSNEALLEHIGQLYSAIASFPGKPSTFQYTKATELNKEVDEFVKKADVLRAQMEELVKTTGLPSMKLRTFAEWKAE